MTRNQRIVLATRPVGRPVATDLRFEEVPVPVPGDGELLLETQWLSLDPYMRGRMSEEASYSPPIALGEVIVGRTISRVLQSRHPGFAAGDLVLAASGWQSHALSDGSGLRRIDPALARPSLMLGVLGSSGFAAYIGLLEVAKVQAGETVAVAAATGPVGATVVQLARRAGARVIAIAGGPRKVAYARDALKADVALDHRDPAFESRLRDAAPAGIDVYFENVGGKVLMSLLPHFNPRARIAICGLIAWYNLAQAPDGPDLAPALLRTVLRKRLLMQGFVTIDWSHRLDDFQREMTAWIAEGSIAYREDVVDGLAQAPAAFFGLLEGENFGKLVVRVAKDA